MKALTIWQPWASLIIAEGKLWEWRGWPAPRWVVGHRIAIHAGARRARTDEIADILARIDDDETSLVGEIAKPLLLRVHRSAWPLSCVLGTAVLGTSIPAQEWARAHAPDFADSDRLNHNKFAWPLSDVDRFEPPIPARGAQGFWNWMSSARDIGV
jgi:hypothetical protein